MTALYDMVPKTRLGNIHVLLVIIDKVMKVIVFTTDPHWTKQNFKFANNMYTVCKY